ncbi:hypothetical protein ACIQWR_37385 [Streptomyces sp. NPDC098789]|uniref:hypothetical protein n=1 Tax=Streptomyces sp. NPDC098789 TaxID=3366098 RepID=UPI003814470E
MHPDDEPVLKRSKWGTNHYYVNPHNPIGLALIVIGLLFTATMLILMANHAGPWAPHPAPAPTTSPAYDDIAPFAPSTTGPSPSPSGSPSAT